jgi:ribosomal protein S18 acetylase RimI-like enzyme
MEAPKPQIILSNEPDPAGHRAILDPLVAFNVSQVGAHQRTPLAMLIEDPASGEVMGRLWGRTSWKWLTIETLFVPEGYRALGLGSEVMRQAEQEAVKRGCIGAWVDTHSYQAPGFYKRLGYCRFGEISDYPPGHSRFFFQQRFE